MVPVQLDQLHKSGLHCIAVLSSTKASSADVGKPFAFVPSCNLIVHQLGGWYVFHCHFRPNDRQPNRRTELSTSGLCDSGFCVVNRGVEYTPTGRRGRGGSIPLMRSICVEASPSKATMNAVPPAQTQDATEMILDGLVPAGPKRDRVERLTQEHRGL